MSVAVKICGLSTPESVDVAVEAGAQFVGFVFFPPSPRAVEPDTARELSKRIPASVRKVAVVVDPSNDSLDAIFEALEPTMIQLHGQETPERVADVGDRFGCAVIKALPVADLHDVARASQFDDAADMLLFDAKAQPGV